jgi:hypothetical protein
MRDSVPAKGRKSGPVNIDSDEYDVEEVQSDETVRESYVPRKSEIRNPAMNFGLATETVAHNAKEFKLNKKTKNGGSGGTSNLDMAPEKSRSKSEKKEKKKKKKKNKNIDDMDEDELDQFEKTYSQKMKTHKFDSNF